MQSLKFGTKNWNSISYAEDELQKPSNSHAKSKAQAPLPSKSGLPKAKQKRPDKGIFIPRRQVEEQEAREKAALESAERRRLAKEKSDRAYLEQQAIKRAADSPMRNLSSKGDRSRVTYHFFLGLQFPFLFIPNLIFRTFFKSYFKASDWKQYFNTSYKIVVWFKAPSIKFMRNQNVCNESDEHPIKN